MYLVVSNIGAVVTPWMLFYQQSALCNRKVPLKEIKLAKAETVIGACIAQSVTCDMIVIMGTTIFFTKKSRSELSGFGEVIDAMAEPMSFFGGSTKEDQRSRGLYAAKLCLTLGVVGIIILCY